MSARAGSGCPLRTALGLLALLCLGGCFSGFKSNLAATQSYVLQPQMPAPASGLPPAAGSATLEVLMPAAAAGLGSDSIAVLRSGGRLDFYAGVRWAGSAPAMLQTLAVDALRVAPGHFALVESDTGPFASQYVLNLEIRHFEALYRGDGPPTVRVALRCTLGRRADRTVLVSFDAEHSESADDDRMHSVVAAFERATADVLAQLREHAQLPAS